MRPTMMCLAIALAWCPVATWAVEVSGEVRCPVDLNVTLEILGGETLGPVKVENGKYHFSIVGEAKEFNLVFHAFPKNPQEVFRDRGRPFSEKDRFYHIAHFVNKDGYKIFAVQRMDFGVLRVKVTLPKPVTMQVSTYVGGSKSSGTRIMEFPKAFTILYLVKDGYNSVGSSVRLQLANPEDLSSDRLSFEVPPIQDLTKIVDFDVTVE